MKNTFKYILFTLAGLIAGQVVAPAAPASGDDDDFETIKLYKTVTQTSEGKYTVNLEAFVTGSSVVSSSTMPVDVALVLDMSRSMNNTIPVYSPSSSQDYSYGAVSGHTYYIKYNNAYCRVSANHRNYFGDKYSLSFTSGGTTYYLTTKGISETREEANGRNTTLWTGILYTSENRTKLSLLKDAVKSFIDIIAENAKGADKTAGTEDDVAHRISIITFASTGEEQIVKGLTDVGNGQSLKTTVDGLSLGTYTQSDLGMGLAVDVMDGVTRESAKVTIMFTDGVPCNTGQGTIFTTSIANGAIYNALTLKNNDVKVYTIGIFDNATTQVQNYMHYVSSNYPTAESMDVPNTGDKSKGFFQLSDGSDLTSIFEKIATETTEDVIDLHESSTSVIDIVSSNFVIPSTVTSANVSLAIHKVDGYNADYKDIDYYERDGVKYYYGYTFVEDAEYLAAHTPSVVRNENTISVTGFDFALGDTIDESTGAITSYGNFVGERDVEGVKTYAGRKIVISFPIELSPDYQGGYLMPSNDIQSGIWVDGDLVKPFPRPMVDFPSICIVKHGLMVGESAIFKVTGTYVAEEGGTEQTVSYNVVLTQKATAQGAKLPCYAVLKRLYSGCYTVEEANWSWMYQPDSNINSGRTNISFDILPADQVGVTYDLLINGNDLTNNGTVIGKTASKTLDSVTMPFVMLKDLKGEYNDSAISVLYEFGNVRKTSGKPARSEAWAHNKFKGGTAESGGSESGSSEEEEL